MAEPCVFCRIVAGEESARVVHEWRYAVAFEPRNPVVPGHVLVVPRTHVCDFAEDPLISAEVMRCTAQLAIPPCNVITSAGSAATQSVFHLHLHIVPRTAGDGLALPWSGGPDAR